MSDLTPRMDLTPPMVEESATIKLNTVEREDDRIDSFQIAIKQTTLPAA